jgi:hemoglobin
MTAMTPPIDALDEEAIALMVQRFYERARRDEQLGPVFDRAVHDWPAHFARLEDFWSSVMLTTGRYKGNPFARHLNRGIEPEMFDRWLDLWRRTAEELFAPVIAKAFVHKADRIGESLRSGMFFRPADHGAGGL